MTSRLSRTAAVSGAVALAALASSPAFAATTVAQSSANAVTVEVAGEGADSGTVSATHNGKRENVTGETQPPVGVLGGQSLLNLGTLHQDARARVNGQRGVSEACAGVAGDGATVAEVGSGNCLTGGDNIGFSIANLDLSDTVVFNPGTALGDLDPQLEPLRQVLFDEVTAAVADGLAPLDQVQIAGTSGVIEAQCMADTRSASGDAQIADAQITATLAGEELVLAAFDPDPAPNTKVVTDLDKVANLVIDSVEASLEESFAQSAELRTLTEPLQRQVIDAVVGQVSDQLAPVEQQALDITLNRQVRPTANSIEVTAIAADVLPAATEQLGAPAVSADIANVTCGPASRVGNPPQDNPDQSLPEVPTVIDSGAEGADGDHTAAAVAGSLAAVSVLGLIGYRRRAASARR